jgi:hypothetical protein
MRTQQGIQEGVAGFLMRLLEQKFRLRPQWHSLKKKTHSLKETEPILKNTGPTGRIRFPARLGLPTKHWMHAIFQ